MMGLLFLITLLFIISCGNEKGGNSNTKDEYDYPDIEQKDTLEETSTEDVEEDVEEDTYSVWTDPCVDCAWYFCGSLDVI